PEEGASSIITNPAGVAVGYGQASFLAAPLLGSGQLGFFSLSHPWRPSRYFGFAAASLTSGEAEQTDSLGRNVGGFKEQDLALYLSYAERVDRQWRWGAGAKSVRQAMADQSDIGWGLDAGVIYQTPERDLRLGLSAQNLAAPRLRLKDGEDKFPLTLRVGPSLGWEVGPSACSLALEGLWLKPFQNRRVARWAMGFEIEPGKRSPLLFRIGLNNREWTTGFGIKDGPVSFDYAVAFHELGLLHRLGFTFRYGYVSPMAQRNLDAQWKLLRSKEEEIRVAFGRLKTGQARGDTKIQQDQAGYQAALAEIERQKFRLSADEKIEKARAFYHAGDYKSALQTAQMALNLIESPQARIIASMSRARILISARHYDVAQSELKKVVQMDPDNDEAATLFRRISQLIGTLRGDSP
ncbi:MAG: tetratricopeptide repeat protein, partial [Elusimicrobiota bacterium]